MPAKQAHIASLDGLRFLAALSVLISHAAYQLYPPGNGDGMSRLAWNLTHLANFGMTLFFVLSGFVIHWNYRQSVQEPGGLKAFFIARWSRLYPHFLVMFVVGITGEVLARGYFFRVMLTTPFFLTFTSTWWYWQIDGLHIFEIYNHPAIGVMWSLATEAFFYAAYPLLAPMAARLSLHRSILSIGLAGALAAATALGLFFFRNEIAAYAAKHFNVADTGQFIFWLGYTSPWMRLSEFLLGVFTAQICIGWFSTAATDRGRHRPVLFRGNRGDLPDAEPAVDDGYDAGCPVLRRYLPCGGIRSIAHRHSAFGPFDGLGRRSELFALPPPRSNSHSFFAAVDRTIRPRFTIALVLPDDNICNSDCSLFVCFHRAARPPHLPRAGLKAPRTV